jgi:hypothetical protein
MPYATLNGLEVPFLEGTLTKTPVNIGSSSRVISGKYFQGVTSRTTDFEGATIPLVEEDHDFLRDFVEGRGHLWSFNEDKFSGDGLGPNAGGTSSISTTEKKFGAASLLIGSGSSIEYELGSAFASGSQWTISVWKRTASNTFTHYAILDDGTQYKAGAVHTPSGSDDVTNWLSMTGSNLTIEGKDIAGTNSASAYYDQLVVRPFRMSAEAILAEASATVAFPALPHLLLAGDIVPRGAIDVCCAVESIPLRTAADGTNLSLSITMHAVEAV